MMSCWVGSTIRRVRLGQRMRMTSHVAVVSHGQAGLIVTIKMACVGRIDTVTIRPLQNHPGQKIRSLYSWNCVARPQHYMGWIITLSECHSVQLGGGLIIMAPYCTPWPWICQVPLIWGGGASPELHGLYTSETAYLNWYGKKWPVLRGFTVICWLSETHEPYFLLVTEHFNVIFITYKRLEIFKAWTFENVNSLN